MAFNEQKSKLVIITRRKPKTKQDYQIYLNNKQLHQENAIKYLGIIINRRLNFNAHIEYTTEKCIRLIHALSKLAKVNWGLRHDVLRGNTTHFVLWSPSLERACNRTAMPQKSREYRDWST